MNKYDLLIRSGTIVDGSGGGPYVGDIAVSDGIIAAVGNVDGRGHREIDATDHIVTPGFVDIHTHYDGQALWEDRLVPSSVHGATTVVAGNCGVGFAPVKPEHRTALIELMEGVEDIPGTAMHLGLTWEWTSFPDFLDALEQRPHDIDLATQVPHAALRFWAMGLRAAAREEATPAEIDEMAALVREAIEAGALGFTTSRTLNHKTRAGTLTPAYGTPVEELAAISAAVGSTGRGVLQFVSDFPDVDEDLDLMRAMITASGGRPLSVSLVQHPDEPTKYQSVLEGITRANEDGFTVRAQVAARTVGILLGLECVLHPFHMNPVWQTISHLSVPEQAARMRTSEMRSAILAAQTDKTNNNFAAGSTVHRYGIMYEYGQNPIFEPKRSDSLENRAKREGRSPEEVAYDIITSNEGRGLLQMTFANYSGGNLDAVHEMLTHPYTLPGLGDGGAHVGSICDSSFTSTLLQYWVRDRSRDRLGLPFVIQRQCRDTARMVGLNDRGELRPGYRADINVIDLDGMRIHPPRVHYDLPGGAGRLLQDVDGYRHTFVAGVETYRDGEWTGALPGRLVRGQRPSPSAAGEFLASV
jgi:N-acyl-D-aspartate/D-glutamate deacylase